MDDVEQGGFAVFPVEMETGPSPQRMIIVKQLSNGDIHAENNDGEMIIVRRDGSVQSFLEGDEDWVKGRTSDPKTAWEIVGFHFGMTDGSTMDRTRNEPLN